MKVMIDIETYATRNDAAIVQIGACVFDEGTIIGEPFLVSVDPAFYEGTDAFYVDEKTLAWWAKQSKAARDSLNINRVANIFLAMDRLVDFFQERGFDQNNRSHTVWANPPQFDLSILRYAASKTYGSDNQVPWSHRQERDMRTLTEIAGRIPWDELDGAEGLVQHRADHDAIRQALVVSKQLERLNG